MHVTTAQTQGTTNIGLYAFATDSYCVIGPEADNLKEDLETVLGVPVIITTIAGTSLAGVFCAGHEDALLVPSITFEHEIEKLENAGITVHVIDTKHTALGNNLVATKHGALIGPMFNETEQNRIAEALGVPAHQFTIADIEVVGSGLAVNKHGGVIHPNASQFEMDMAKDTLRLKKLLQGTINFGSPYVRSGLIANQNGFLAGEKSGGPEVTNADEAFGFIDG